MLLLKKDHIAAMPLCVEMLGPMQLSFVEELGGIEPFLLGSGNVECELTC